MTMTETRSVNSQAAPHDDRSPVVTLTRRRIDTMFIALGAVATIARLVAG